jgi:hypothetical protein
MMPGIVSHGRQTALHRGIDDLESGKPWLAASAPGHLVASVVRSHRRLALLLQLLRKLPVLIALIASTFLDRLGRLT